MRGTWVSAASAAPSLSLSNKYNGIRGKWTAVSGASHYIVYFRRASETQWSSDIAYSNYYPLLNTEPGTLYCMQVQGVAADGTRGSYSRVKSLTFIPRAEIKICITTPATVLSGTRSRAPTAT